MLRKKHKHQTVYIDISNTTILRLFGIAVALFLGVWAVHYLSAALTLIFIAFFLAIALNPPVSFIASKLPSGSRGTATALSYLVVLSILGLILYATIPPLVSQSQLFIDNIPEYIEDARTGDSFIADTVRRFELEERLQELQDNLSPDKLTTAGGPIFDFFQTLSSSLVAVLTVLVMTFFMLIEGPAWMKRFWEIQPKEHRQHRQNLVKKMYQVVTGYVNGQLLIAFIASMSALVMMTILKLFDINIPFIIPMAFVIGVFGLIPLIGATLGAVLVVIVSLFESVGAAVIMAIFFLVYQQIENNAIQPIIQSRSVELSPLTIFIAAIVGVSLAGLLGAIIAIPVAAWIRIILVDYFEHHHHPKHAAHEAKN